MSSKTEAIVFGDDLPLKAPVTVTARLETSLRSNHEKLAIVSDDDAIDYERLDSLTKHFANQILIRTGCNTLVPVLSAGGTDYCVAILACIRAGRPFVPLDVHWPRNHLINVIEQLDPGLLVTTEEISFTDVKRDHETLIVRSSEFSGKPDQNTDEVTISQRPYEDSLIYGFFTSGTTGLPKCALNIHRGLVNRIDYMTQQFGPGRTTLLNSSHVFDSSLWQILWPITTGGTVSIPKRSGPLDLNGTIESIARWQVEMTDFVPSVFEALVHAIECDLTKKSHLLKSLDIVIIGGEEANAEVVRRFRAALPWVNVVNTYGPTEASIGSVFCRLGPQTADRIPLGKPITNTFSAIVSADNTIAARGETGQIVIGGACLGGGYLRDETKTKQAFCTARSAETNTDYTVYLTGDLGHMDEFGTLWFHGRLDDQLKIAGVRVEPGEIEYHLNKHPAISSSKVVGVEGVAGGWRIAAFYRATEPISSDELKSYLSRSIPREWIPSIFRWMETFPLTHNGKVNRRALVKMLAHDFSQSATAACRQKERISEITLVKILTAWQTCFDDQSLTKDADFFDLGGDSLIAVHLCLYLEEALGRRVTQEAIFASRTPQTLARWLCSSQEEDETTSSFANEDDALSADLESFKRFPVIGPKQTQEVHRVVLTGVTGYVGSHVLADLLADDRFSVTCLVRAPEVAQAKSRVFTALAAVNDRLQARADALQVLPADLGKERFGLSPSEWDHLAETTQAVVHMAAEVDFIKPYDSLRQVNVGGLLQALDLCTSKQQKRLYFISSISVVGAEVGDNVAIPESLISRDWPKPDSGYDLSKWVCEAGLGPLFARGLPVKVFRLGEMMPPAQGAFNPRSLVTILLESCAVTGAYPVIDMSFDWTPVDYFAKALVNSIGESGFSPEVINFKSPVSVRFEDLIHLSGLSEHLEPLALEAFLQRLHQALKEFPRHPEIGRALSLLERQRHESDNLVRVERKFSTDIAEGQLNRLRLGWITPSRASHAQCFSHVFRTMEAIDVGAPA